MLFIISYLQDAPQKGLLSFFRKWIDLEGANICQRAKIWFTQKTRKERKQFAVLKVSLFEPAVSLQCHIRKIRIALSKQPITIVAVGDKAL